MSLSSINPLDDLRTTWLPGISWAWNQRSPFFPFFRLINSFCLLLPPIWIFRPLGLWISFMFEDCSFLLLDLNLELTFLMQIYSSTSSLRSRIESNLLWLLLPSSNISESRNNSQCSVSAILCLWNSILFRIDSLDLFFLLASLKSLWASIICFFEGD